MHAAIQVLIVNCKGPAPSLVMVGGGREVHHAQEAAARSHATAEMDALTTVVLQAMLPCHHALVCCLTIFLRLSVITQQQLMFPFVSGPPVDHEKNSHQYTARQQHQQLKLEYFAEHQKQPRTGQEALRDATAEFFDINNLQLQKLDCKIDLFAEMIDTGWLTKWTKTNVDFGITDFYQTVLIDWLTDCTVILCADCVLQISNWKSKADGKQTFFSRICLFTANADSLFGASNPELIINLRKYIQFHKSRTDHQFTQVHTISRLIIEKPQVASSS